MTRLSVSLPLLALALVAACSTTPEPVARPTPSTAAAIATSAAPTSPAEGVIRGTGNKLVELSPEQQPEIWLAVVTHDGEAAFSVTPRNTDGSASQDFLMNTVGAYSGTTFLEAGTTALDVEADGAWTINLKPVESARTWSQAEITGTGDDVLVMSPRLSKRTPATAEHVGAGRFSVRAWTGNGSRLIVNRIGAWAGRATLPNRTVLVEVNASDAWTLNAS